MRHGVFYYAVRPGFDAQGRKRIQWTQIVADGVPIWEHKRRAEVNEVVDLFDSQWKKAFGSNQRFSTEAVAKTREARMRVFRDGRSGVEPAQSLTRDGRGDGHQYCA